MYNSKNRPKYNSKLAIRKIDPSTDLTYQALVSDAAYGESQDQRLGKTKIEESSGMWDNNLKHWSEGNYPSIGQMPEGLRSASMPHIGFASELAGLPATVSRADVGDDHPAITGERKIFSGIKNYDSGRHFDVHLYYEPDGPDSFRLKASTHINNISPKIIENEDGTTSVDHSTSNLHGDHVFDVESGVWHKKVESHTSPNTVSSYNPIGVLAAAPEDFADTTRGWKLPPPSDGFCRECHRFPKSLSNQNELMKPTRCTSCGQEGVLPKFPWANSAFPEGAESSSFNQPISLACGNTKCVNHNKSIANEPAFIDDDYNIIYPGDKGSQERRFYTFTPETLATKKEEHEYRKTTKRDELLKMWKHAYDLGDLSENEEYKAAVKAIQSNENAIREINYQLGEGNHRVVDKLPEDIAKAYEGFTSVPFKLVYDNPLVKETYEKTDEKGKRNIRSIRLPMRSLFCDHSDCSSHEGRNKGLIFTQTDRQPDSSLPCSHCGRNEQDGVQIARTDGYNRCNPTVYGENTCAPVPEGVDAEAYLGWKKPSPDFKMPVARPDDKTGAGFVIQKTQEDQDINNSEGIYPGTQAVYMRNPNVPSSLIGHGIEDPRTYFKYGKYRPWAFLGMGGRKVGKKGQVVRDEESITPEEYDHIISTPILGEVDPENFAWEDLLPEVDIPIRNKYGIRKRKKQIATNERGEVIHPELTQRDWNDFIGWDTKEVHSPAHFFSKLADKYLRSSNNTPKTSSLRKQAAGIPETGQQVTSEIPDSDDFYSSYDPNDYEFSQERAIPERPEAQDRTIVNFGIDAPAADLIECPECNKLSIINTPQFKEFSDKGRRKYYKSPEYVCPTCENRGWIQEVNTRTHCADCPPESGCKGVTDSNDVSAHCPGCPEHDNAINGLPVDVTPGRHLRNQFELQPSATDSVSLLKNRVRNNSIPNPEDEGLNPEDKSAIEYAKTELAKKIEEDIANGYVRQTAYDDINDIEENGPFAWVRDNPVLLQHDPELNEAIQSDLQRMRQEKPYRVNTVNTEPGALFDNPDILAQEEAINSYEGDDDLDQETTDSVDRKSPVIDISPKVQIEHDPNCKKCNNGIIIPEVVGPERMQELNDIIGEGTAIIKRNVKDPQERFQQLAQLRADTYKCRG